MSDPTATTPGRTGERPDRDLALELVRVTEAAALAAGRWVGRGDKNGADGVAVEAMREVGIDISGEQPKPVDYELARDVDLVVTLGREAQLDPLPGTRVENWDTDEPSERGIDGLDRMRLVRDDIIARVQRLHTTLTNASA